LIQIIYFVRFGFSAKRVDSIVYSVIAGGYVRPLDIVGHANDTQYSVIPKFRMLFRILSLVV